MSQKDDDEISNPDESAINAVVNALAAADLKELNSKWVKVTPDRCPSAINRYRFHIFAGKKAWRIWERLSNAWRTWKSI